MRSISAQRRCDDGKTRWFIRFNECPGEHLWQAALWCEENVIEGSWYLESQRVLDWRSKYTNYRKVSVIKEYLKHQYVDGSEYSDPCDTGMEIFYFDAEGDALQFKLRWG